MWSTYRDSQPHISPILSAQNTIHARARRRSPRFCMALHISGIHSAISPHIFPMYSHWISHPSRKSRLQLLDRRCKSALMLFLLPSKSSCLTTGSSGIAFAKEAARVLARRRVAIHHPRARDMSDALRGGQGVLQRGSEVQQCRVRFVLFARRV